MTDDPRDTLAAFRANVDQALPLMRELAAPVAAFFHGLIEAGVPAESAATLASALLLRLLTPQANGDNE